MNKKTFRAGSVNLPAIMAKIFLANKMPQMTEDYCRAILAREIDGLNKKEVCPNCGASMAEYIFPFDTLDALLLLSMAKAIRNKREAGISFNQANQVHVPSLRTSLSIKCRTTICYKLGLVAKVKNDNGSHARGVWLITERGWKALRGEPVPAFVKVFRGKIEERFDLTTTMQDIFLGSKNSLDRVIRDKRQIDEHYDYRSEIRDYRGSDWYLIAGPHQGALLNNDFNHA
jgi:hypothetical protein